MSIFCESRRMQELIRVEYKLPFGTIRYRSWCPTQSQFAKTHTYDDANNANGTYGFLVGICNAFDVVLSKA